MPLHWPTAGRSAYFFVSCSMIVALGFLASVAPPKMDWPRALNKLPKNVVLLGWAGYCSPFLSSRDGN